MGYNDPHRETPDWWKDTHNWPGNDPAVGSRSSASPASNVNRGGGGGGNSGGGGGNSGGGGGCFPAGTIISTPNGICDIARLSNGDLVLAVDIHTNQIRKRKILKVVVHDANKIWVLRLSDGSVLRTTAVHSFLINGIWKKASQIREGDKLAVYSSQGVRDITIDASEASDSVETVYNLIVDGDFNFIASGILTHSFTYLRTLRVILWSLAIRKHSVKGKTMLIPYQRCMRLLQKIACY
jgi:hypothetical protein